MSQPRNNDTIEDKKGKSTEITDHKINSNSAIKNSNKTFVVNNDLDISAGLNNCVGIDRMLLSRIASTASACESQVSAVPVVCDVEGSDIRDVRFSLVNQSDSDSCSGEDKLKSNIDKILIPPEEATESVSLSDQGEKEKSDNKTHLKQPESPEDVDFVLSDKWKEKEKHVFIFSQAGKPIYSRYGQEDRLVMLTGIMQALLSIGETRSDRLHCIKAGGHQVVFLSRGNIYIVAASRSADSEAQTYEQLKQVHGQLLSVLTSSQLDRMFRARTNYDLRIMLAGTEKFFDSLLNTLDSDVGFLLNSVKNFPMASSTRDVITNIIATNARIKDLVYAIYLCRGQLVSKVCMKEYRLHHRDLSLVVNLVEGSESFKSSETWTPLCLPHFDSSLARNYGKLQQNSHLAAISKQVKVSPTNLYCPLPSDLKPYCKHFVYKMSALDQYTLSEPLHQHPRWFAIYTRVIDLLKNTDTPNTDSTNQQLFRRSDLDVIYTIINPTYELYVIFDPLTTKMKSQMLVAKLMKHLKKCEDTEFTYTSATF